MKLLIGGSPCTYWSIAQTKNRETEASGMGWELFRNYVLARDKLQPDYFLYENNKSMSPKIRAQITQMLGVEPVCINSALVSAQNRQRLYWVGRRRADGTYEQVQVEQPEDRGLLLRDILESGVCWREKGYTMRASEGGKIADSHAIRSITTGGKEACDGVAEPVRVGDMPNAKGEIKGGQAHRIYDANGKGVTLTARPNGGGVDGPLYSEPVKVLTDRETEYMIRETKDGRNHFEFGYFQDGNQDKGKCLTANTSRGVPYNVLCEPVRVGTVENDARNAEYDSQQYRVYSPDGKSVTLCGNGGGLGAKTGLYAVPAGINHLGSLYGQHTRWGVFGTDGKVPTLTASAGMGGGHVPMYPICVDNESGQNYIEDGEGKKIPIYQVLDGMIGIKGKQYPIKLADGWYIIRKLTVTECKRLQTVPESYEFPVSDSQAYKMLGNGWTVDVIAHLMSHFDGITTEPVDVLSMYDGMACGHIALDKLGANVRNYYATEIDKYAIKTATHNFPDIVQLGDAFKIRGDSAPVEQKCLPEVVEKGA